MLAEKYPAYLETTVTDRFIKHEQLVQILSVLKTNPLFKVSVEGHSFEGRSLNLLKAGSGETRVFIWTQMHGDEATATMAICDLLNYLASDEPDESRDFILQQCTLYILPMVNPDGAEVFTRRNAQGIDINRDFHRQQTPEGRVLRSLRDQIEPHFGFNMHDQSTLWSTGKTGNPASISLLAPAYDAELSINPVRRNAINVISKINAELQLHIPGHIGRFDDEYEFRAFGDNFQAAGTSTILIEAGGYKNDPEKQFLRKITFFALVKGLETISKENYPDEDNSSYFGIPENEKRHCHLIIRNCHLGSADKTYTIDIGLVAEQKLNDDLRSVTYTYMIEDVGDLDGWFSYEEIDATGFKLILIQPLILNQNADFILQDQLNTVLCIENGFITTKNL